jgi:hypothetical protein
MTQDILSSFVGILLSLAFSYIPGFSDWYYTLDKKWRGLVFFLSCLLVASGIFLFSCTNWFTPVVPCTQQGLEDLIKMLLLAWLTGTATYLASPSSPAKTRLANKTE